MREQALLDGLRADPGSAQNWLDLAQALWRRGGRETARKLLHRALALPSADSSLLRQAAFFLEEEEEHALAETFLRRVLAQEPDSAEARLQHARLLWRSSSLEPSGGPEARERLLWATGRVPEAALALERSLARGRPSEWAVDQAFAFFVETGEFARAGAFLDTLAPSSPMAAACLATLRLWQGRPREALSLAERGLKKDPASAAARRARVGALAMLGRRAEALRGAHAHLRRAPRDAEARLWRGELNRLSGRTAQARRDLEAAARLGHESTALVFQRALLEAPRPGSAWAAALDRAQAGLLGNRSRLETFLARGTLFRTPLRPKAMYDGYDTKSDPNTAPALVAGFLLRQIRARSPEALIADYSALVAEKPEEPEFRAHRGEIRLWLGRYDEALADFEAVGLLKNARLWWMVAQAGTWMLQGRVQEALERLDESERRGALITAIAPWRGECLRRLGRSAEVPAELARARARFPFHVSVWINLALACRDMGDSAACARISAALARQAPDLISEAGGLENALVLMRGNRSSSCPTYFPAVGGRLRAVRLRGC